jgi:hypothetical protein
MVEDKIKLGYLVATAELRIDEKVTAYQGDMEKFSVCSRLAAIPDISQQRSISIQIRTLSSRKPLTS